MKKKFVNPLLAVILLLSACSTDLDVVGNYKETMVVYGLLDQSQSKQYIKINKAYLGRGNALEYAKIKDSTQFTNALNVKIIRLSDNKEFILSPDNTVAKNTGTFYAPDQANAIYSFPSAPGDLPTSSNYKLIIKNSETGTEVSSQTSLVEDFTITNPRNTIPLSPTFSFIGTGVNFNLPFRVEWNTSKNARAYQVTIRFNYKDYIDNNNDGIIDDSVAQKLDWVFPAQKTTRLDGGETMSNDFRGEDYMRFIGNQLSNYSTLFKRVAGTVDLMVVAASDDLNTFIEVNAPSTGIIQEKPEFTNISNGLGIFSSRYNKPLSPVLSRKMSSLTLDTLACGQYTKYLKFVNGSGQLDPQGRPVQCK